MKIRLVSVVQDKKSNVVKTRSVTAHEIHGSTTLVVGLGMSDAPMAKAD